VGASIKEKNVTGCRAEGRSTRLRGVDDLGNGGEEKKIGKRSSFNLGALGLLREKKH